MDDWWHPNRIVQAMAAASEVELLEAAWLTGGSLDRMASARDASRRLCRDGAAGRAAAEPPAS